MAEKVNVPGFNQSTGRKKFAELSPGEYVLEVTACKFGMPDWAKAPIDAFEFTFKILEGPPDVEGNPVAGQKAWNTITFLRPEHPDYNPKWDDPKSGEYPFATDDLKSMALAFGVTADKKNNIEPEAFVGLKAKARRTYTMAKNGKKYGNWVDWEAVE